VPFDFHAAQSASAFLLRHALQQGQLPHSPGQQVEAAQQEVSPMNHALVWLLLSAIFAAFAAFTEITQWAR
jgi:hypothetical protein